ncbi:MAG: Gfo/Idh/MocA family oxidoreductase [Phycisphaeraceae bacterium]|nr:Gfo/Idh/MocA family oxidoreductase [Phycisphaerales bacterium]QOJ18598.1 MAG: Gfo/Idh/MocA family oxidoreductase [Phycisphaeraceae bacterium]
MIGVGIIGFGLMGRTHAQAYAIDLRAQLRAIADLNPTRFQRKDVQGNIAGLGAGEIDPATVRLHDSVAALLDDPAVQAVSICTPTATHVDLTIAALRSGKHVMVEKPLGLSSAASRLAVDEASRHPGLVAMPAMCMRFWPGWSWLREIIREEPYGPVQAASFLRMGARPGWSSFYTDPAQSGGAMLDLHIHDADFVRSCFGNPRTVESRPGDEDPTGTDHVVTRYRFDAMPHVEITAEGGWRRDAEAPFVMRFHVRFEQAEAVFDLSQTPVLRLRRGGDDEPVELPPGDGYRYEVRAFLDAIEQGTPVPQVSMHDGAEAVRLIECERESIRTGRPVNFAPASR